jgi:hypothetical protein
MSSEPRNDQPGTEDFEKLETKAVHFYENGKSACSISEKHGSPMTWPRGHTYSRRWEDVTCEECLAAKPEGA